MGTHVSTPGSWPELDALVSEMLETRRAIARAQARESQLLSAAVDLAIAHRPDHRSSSDIAMREISAELGAAMRVSDRTVQTRMGDAVALETRFPAVLSAWQEGRMDAGHVNAILDAGADIQDDDARRRFEARAIEIACETTPALLRGHAKAIAAELDPSSTAERMRHAQGERRVRVFDLDDGMARVLADLPATLAYAIADRLTQMARAAQTDEARDVESASGGALGAGAGSDAARSPGVGGGSDAGGSPGVSSGSDADRESGESRDTDTVHEHVVTRPRVDADVRTIDQLRPTSSPTFSWQELPRPTATATHSRRSPHTCR